MLKSFEEIFKKAEETENLKLALVGAADESSVKAVVECARRNWVDPILIGPKKEVEEVLKRLNAEDFKDEIVDVEEFEEMSKTASSLVREGKAQLIMKGLIHTASFMRPVLDKETGIRTDRLISHVLFFEDEKIGKLRLITDGGIVPYPDAKKKAGILHNAVLAMKGIGVYPPKIALVAGGEGKDRRIRAIDDAWTLKEMQERGELPEDWIMDGPFGVDVALSEKAAEKKKIQSPVAGTADILLMPNLEAGNVAYKILKYFYPEIKAGGFLMGARVPVVLMSRADDFQTKLRSIAVAKLAYEHC
jgi:phosphate butyryltransferase